MTVFETNRGCPYKCSFCYWGRGDDLSVRQFENERIMEELDWISKCGIPYLHSGDANWGMFPRDLEFSKRIADNSARYGMPIMLNYAAAKSRVGVQRSATVSRQRKWDTWGLRVKRELQSLRGWDPTPSKGCP